jgi:hypothetical protein
MEGSSPGDSPTISVGIRLLVLALVAAGLAAGLSGAVDLGDEPRLLRISVAALCFLGVWLLLTVRSLRREVGLVRDLLDDVRFGSGTKRDRDAVDILVKALRAPDERARETALRTLRNLSGFDFGEDPATWEAWWRASRATFVRPSRTTEK